MNQTPPVMDVNQIVADYEQGTLSRLDDVTLAKAADALDYTRRHFFDELDIGALSVADFRQAQGRQQYLRTISNAIWKLLLTRYGCDD